MTKNNKQASDSKMAIAAAAGAAAIGAGAYYLLGPNGKANQKKMKALMLKMKNEVKKEVKKAKEISVPIYNKAVDVISENYAKQYKLHEEDIRSIAKKLKSEWQGIGAKASRTAKKVKRSVTETKGSKGKKA